MSAEVQGTVAAYDAGPRDGRVLLDDGSELAFPGSALRPEVLRLRPGQRVRLALADGAVSGVTLVGMPLHPLRQAGRSPAWRTMGG